jgi:glycine cleavage system H protein
VAKQRKKIKRESSSEPVLRFSEEHLWVRVEDERAQMGISEIGQRTIGEILAVELPDVGEKIEFGEPFGEFETVRTVHELIAPVSGTVVAINSELEDQPELANEDPYYEGWLIEVELNEESELDDLMATEEYEEFVAADDED